MSSFPCLARAVSGPVRPGIRWATGWWIEAARDLGPWPGLISGGTFDS